MRDLATQQHLGTTARVSLPIKEREQTPMTGLGLWKEAQVSQQTELNGVKGEKKKDSLPSSTHSTKWCNRCTCIISAPISSMPCLIFINPWSIVGSFGTIFFFSGFYRNLVWKKIYSNFKAACESNNFIDFFRKGTTFFSWTDEYNGRWIIRFAVILEVSYSKRNNI